MQFYVCGVPPCVGRGMVSMPACASKVGNVQLVPTKTILQPAKAAAIHLQAPHAKACPPLHHTFLLTQNLIFKTGYTN